MAEAPPAARATAFVDEVAWAVLAYQAALAAGEEAHDIDDRRRGRARGVHHPLPRRARWPRLRRCVGPSRPLALASTPTDRFDHVLVDDHETSEPVVARLLDRLVADARSVCVAGSHVEQPDIELTTPFRHLDRPPELVRSGHPAVEAEAIAGELLAARADGVPWAQMAVLVRRPSSRAPTLTRALARHRIPVAPVPGLVTEEPIVRAIVDMLRWVNGDRAGPRPAARLPARRSRCHDRPRHPAPGTRCRRRARPRSPARAAGAGQPARRPGHAGRPDDPAALAYEVWRRALIPWSHTTARGSPGDDHALDAIVALPRRAERHTERNPGDRLPQYVALLDAPVLDTDPWRVVGGAAPDAVTIRRSRRRGREWDTVVVAGCVEGELPSIHGRIAFFDRAQLEGADVPSVAERRRRSLADERRLFDERGVHPGHAPAGRQRGTRARCAPEPVRRRVAGASPDLPLAPGRPPLDRPPTAGTRPDLRRRPAAPLRQPVSTPTTTVRCATRTNTSCTCAARPGCRPPWARVFHEVLADFLDPTRTEPRTREALTRSPVSAGATTSRATARRRRRPGATTTPCSTTGGRRRARCSSRGSAPRSSTSSAGSASRSARTRSTAPSTASTAPTTAPASAIVDYKTGKKEPSTDDMADNLQLAVYHLAASRDEELMALGPATELRLLYPRTMKAYEQEIVAGHAEATEARILDRGRAHPRRGVRALGARQLPLLLLPPALPLQPEGREVGDP